MWHNQKREHHQEPIFSNLKTILHTCIPQKSLTFRLDEKKNHLILHQVCITIFFTPKFKGKYVSGNTISGNE